MSKKIIRRCGCGKHAVACMCADHLARMVATATMEGQNAERVRIAGIIKGGSFAYATALSRFSEETGVDTAHTKELLTQIFDSLTYVVQRGPDGGQARGMSQSKLQ